MNKVTRFGFKKPSPGGYYENKSINYAKLHSQIFFSRDDISCYTLILHDDNVGYANRLSNY